MAKDENKKIKKENKNEFKNLKAELKKVVWPTPKQLANNTIAVITIVLITAIIVFALDFTFKKMNEYGIEKLKSSVETKNETNTVEAGDATVDDNGNITENSSEGETVVENSEEQNSSEQTSEATNAEEQNSEQNTKNTNSEE